MSSGLNLTFDYGLGFWVYNFSKFFGFGSQGLWNFIIVRFGFLSLNWVWAQKVLQNAHFQQFLTSRFKLFHVSGTISFGFWNFEIFCVWFFFFFKFWKILQALVRFSDLGKPDTSVITRSSTNTTTYHFISAWCVLKHCSRFFTLHDLPNLGITFEDLGFFLSLGNWCFDLFLWCISLLKHITKCKSSKNAWQTKFAAVLFMSFWRAFWNMFQIIFMT